MTPNVLYQRLVEALEALLPPRVVSRVLREGVTVVGATPETLDLAQAESLLKGAVFRQLQLARPPEQAREIVANLITRAQAVQNAVERETAPAALRVVVRGSEAPEVPAEVGTEASDQAPAGPGPAAFGATPAVSERLARLREALRPLNLYFGWAEVRKLRAQLQLIDDEERAGRDTTALVDEAETQLDVVGQKLEDQLVLQARDLADLEESVEAVAALGGHRVRRLESLVGTVRDAQRQRTVAEAEVERAQRLARDLRKLVESSVLDEGEAPPDLGRGDGRPTRRFDPGRERPARTAPASSPAADEATDALTAAEAGDIDPSKLSPEIGERLRALDVDGERREAAALATRYAEVLRYVPARADDLEAIGAAHAEQRPVGGQLAALTATLGADERTHRDALRGEFAALRAELEAFAPEIDVTDLRRAVRVVLDVLDDALPPLDDVNAARDLHTELSERAEAAVRGAAEIERRALALRAQGATLLGRLDAAVDRGREVSTDTDNGVLHRAFEDLSEARDALASAGTAEGPDAALLERARDAEAAWERAVAEASDDRSERRRARVRELHARLGRLPDEPSIRPRKASLSAEVEALEGQPDLTDAHVRTLGTIVDQLAEDARAAMARRLDQLARQAGEPTPEALLRTLQAAARSLDEGGFPDLEAVEREVRHASDDRRAELRRRYLRARQEARRFGASGVPAAEGLEALVAAARTALEEDVAPEAAVDRLEAAATEADTQVAARLAGFDDRLDAALATFRRVARLNNDDVSAARRVLHHLDGQRASLARVSLGLQARLFEALADAEGRLTGLVEAFEATRAIADQLVAGNLLDDVLGGFDALFGTADEPPAPAHHGDAGVTRVAPGAASRDDDRVTAALEALWHPYLDLPDVTGAVVLDPHGAVRAGRPPSGSDLVALARSLREADAPWSALGGRFGDEAPEVAVLDAGGPSTLVASLADAGYAVVWTTHAGASAGVGRRLRDDHADLAALLREGSTPASEPEHGSS